MNYSEYFGKNPNAGWGASGKKDSANEDWSDYFKPNTQQVPIKKVYSDSPVVVDNRNGNIKTYMDVDPVVVQRPTHEQMVMQQQQMAISNRMAQQQKDYYSKIWDNKVNQMEDEFAPSDKPKEVKKLSFVDKPKANVADAKPVEVAQNIATAPDETQSPVNEEPHRAYGDNTPLTEAEIDDAMAKLNAAAQKRREEEAAQALTTEEEIQQTPEPVVEETPVIEEEPVKEPEPVEPILPLDAEVEALVEDDETEVLSAPEVDDILGGLNEADVTEETPAEAEEENAVPEDLPEDLPEDIEELNIDEEYEAKREARIKSEAATEKKRRTTKKTKDDTASEKTTKRKKPVVTIKKKK